MADDKLGF